MNRIVPSAEVFDILCIAYIRERPGERKWDVYQIMTSAKGNPRSPCVARGDSCWRCWEAGSSGQMPSMHLWLAPCQRLRARNNLNKLFLDCFEIYECSCWRCVCMRFKNATSLHATCLVTKSFGCSRMHEKFQTPEIYCDCAFATWKAP